VVVMMTIWTGVVRCDMPRSSTNTDGERKLQPERKEISI
jgi:hypothetical protein